MIKFRQAQQRRADIVTASARRHHAAAEERDQLQDPQTVVWTRGSLVQIQARP